MQEVEWHEGEGGGVDCEEVMMGERRMKISRRR